VNDAAKGTVLITGGTDGLGKAMALLLADRGYRVFAGGRSNEKRTQLDSLAREKKLPLETFEMDVCSDESVRSGVDYVLSATGAIDVLINNAGVGYMAVVEDLRMEDLRQQYETNMRARKKGRILMMSSVAGLLTPPTYGAYSSSKHALEGLSNALRLELYPFGIQVILIEPGYIVTNFQQTARELTAPYAAAAMEGPYAKVYSGAWAAANKSRGMSKTTPEDCARVILRAIEARNPKARYTVTPLATVVTWAKRFLSDRMMDAFILRRTGLTRE
jgi:NAD(P)-dependent dehydrogenase (short-subunit alcohol dehydrogenase family)